MNNDDRAIESLRDALSVSPDNLPLRKHLAETLLGRGRHEEAEAEYRTAMKRHPDDWELQVGLAKTYYQQGKDTHALVVIEELVRQRDTPAEAFLLHARLLLRTGDVDFAVSEYKCA
ncbi:MAG TPA: tetratricopeptide repeat protein, partial [Planctomycetaceae bacterium]|nr:tetratricopeptide repeat protein [Planctomycetaceae bacterium]